MQSVSGECMQVDSLGSNPRLSKNMRNEKFITLLCFFLPRATRWKTVSCYPRKLFFFRSRPYALLICLAHHACYLNRWNIFAIQ